MEMDGLPDQEWLETLLKLNDAEAEMTEKQARIIRAAVEIFAEKGYSATSTSEIARKAEVAEGTIFRYYKTKKDLLLSISASLMSKLMASLVLHDFNKLFEYPYERFEDFLRAVIMDRREFALKHLPLIKVLLQEVPFHPELREHFARALAIPTLERVVEVVERFQKKGQLIDMPTTSAVRLIATPIFGYLIIRYLITPEQPWDDEYEIDLMIRFIMHGLAADGKS